MNFYGQNFPVIGKVDEFLYNKYFLNKKNGFFIECGAADGFNLSSCKFFEETMGWKGINMEASPDKYSKLVENRPDSFLNLNKGLLHTSGTFVFRDDTVTDPTRYAGWGNGSFQHTEKHFIELHKMGIQLKESEIEVMTFSELVEEYDVKEIDLFILDVEGMELHVIQGMRDSKTLPKMMFVEHEHVGLKETEESLKELGYRLDWNDHCNSAYILDV